MDETDLDLDAIINAGSPFSTQIDKMKYYMERAIHRALVLASENAETTYDSAGNVVVNRQSILDIEKLIVGKK